MENLRWLQTADNDANLSWRDAYERALPDILAVHEDVLVYLNLDVTSCVVTVLGVCKKLATLRGRFALLPELDQARLDKLETYALAAWHAHASHVAAARPRSPVKELGARAAACREQLLSDVVALGKRGLVDVSRLDELRGPIGYTNLAVDLGLLCALLRAHWNGISNKTALTLDEISEAELVSQQLITAVGRRKLARPQIAAATLIRLRAISLLINTYDQARRAVGYLRWNEGDAELFAPSLYARGTKAKRRKASASKISPDVSDGATPTAASTPSQMPYPASKAHETTALRDSEDPRRPRARARSGGTVVQGTR